MAIDLSAMKQAIFLALEQHAREAGGSIAEDLAGPLRSIAAEAATYAVQGSLGGEEVKAQNLKHLAVQAELVGTIIFTRENDRAIETFKAIVVSVGQVLLPLAKGLL